MMKTSGLQVAHRFVSSDAVFPGTEYVTGSSDVDPYQFLGGVRRPVDL